MIDIPAGWATVLVAMVGIVPTTLSAVLAVFLRRVGKDAAVARHELQNNSGSSTRDAIDRIEHKLVNDFHRIQRLDKRVSATGAGVVVVAAVALAPFAQRLLKKVR